MKKTIKINDTKNRVYGVIGMVALFLMGAIFGYIINGSDRVNHSMMTERGCIELQDQIMNMVRNVHNYDAQKIAQLDKMFSENCNDRDFRDAEKNVPVKPAIVEDEPKLPDATCEQIEFLLTDRLNCDLYNPECRVERAQIYANLSERGCPQNSAKYKDLAAKELEIARALTDDNIQQNQHEATEMVETYKRLHMQAEAAKMLEKAKKLTNPAIDFIIELEKIIEE